MERTELTKSQVKKKIEYHSDVVRSIECGEAIVVVDFECESIIECSFPQLALSKDRAHAKIRTSDFVIKNCEIDEIILQSVTGQSITFDGGKINRILFTSDRPADSASANRLEKIIIKNINHPLSIVLMYIENMQALQIENCSQIQDIVIENVVVSQLAIHQTDVKNEVSLSLTRLINHSTITGRTFGTLSITDCIIKTSLSLSSLEIKHKLIIVGGSCKSLYLTHKMNVPEFIVENNTLNSLSFLNGKYGLVDLKPTSIETLNTSTESHLNTITMKRFKLDAMHGISDIALSFRDLDVDNFEIRNLRNEGKLVIQDSVIKERFAIEDSKLDANAKVAKFQNLNLEKCNNISFYNTDLIGIELFKMRWNKNYLLDDLKLELRKKGDETKLHSYYTIKESYRQLKIVSNENSNKIDATWFHKGELDMHFKILSIEKTFFNSDRLTLFFSRTFGGYGLNFWKPFGFWMAFHSLLFSYIIITKFKYRFDFQNIDWVITRKAAAIFLTLLSPVHNDTVYDVPLFGIPDILTRVIAGFFIYYIIRASRKFID